LHHGKAKISFKLHVTMEGANNQKTADIKIEQYSAR
jgi:hypothetical protein